MRRMLEKLIPAAIQRQSSRYVVLFPALVLLAAAQITVAQEPETGNGAQWGAYTAHQTVELGGHVGDVSGSVPMFDTFVNWSSGPRLLSYSLDLHAQPGNGMIFDDLTTSSFGYGGDPNDMTMLRASKGKWYTLNATFRRDRNFFDYDLLANPLNPTASSPSVQIGDSPHLFNTTRKMSDISLTLLPLSVVKFRLEYTRNVNDGPFFSTIHEGTEGLLAGTMRTGLDTYRIGVDYKVLPRTNISYDQTFNVFKDDTNYSLANTNMYSFGNLSGYQLAGGIPVSLGVSFNTPAGQPCATPVLGTGAVNPACNGYFGYGRNTGARGFFPTEQLSMQSSYFKRVDFSARASYSAGNSDITSANETFSGLITRNRNRAFVVSEPGSAEKVTTTADLGVTVHITDHLSFVDTFRWDAFRIPGFANQNTSTLFGATLLSNPNIFNPATCPPPFTAATCPQHNASSNSDLQSSQFFTFTGQNEQLNTTQLQYDFNSRVGGDIGYRYGHRQINASLLENDLFTIYPTLALPRGCPTSAPCTTTGAGAATFADTAEINEHSLLAGVWLRPMSNLRINFDTEFFYADNVYTRISPRHLQHYRARAKYQPRKWITFSSAINIIEQRNNDLDVGHLQHDRTYNFAAIFVPSEKWSLDVNYSYIDTFSQTNICFVATPTTPGTISCGTPYLSGISLYDNTGNFGSFNLIYKPIRRITTSLGYTITSNDGNTLLLNPNAPLGPLESTYYQPTASVSWQFAKYLTGKAGWNYWDYTEGANTAPTAARNFHANFGTFSLIYAF